MKLNFAFRKGLFVFTASLFLLLSLLGQTPLQAASLDSAPGYSQMIAQADAGYPTNISPGNQFGDNPPAADLSTLGQREGGFEIGKVVRKVEAATQTIPGSRMKDIGKIQRDPVKQAGAKAEKAAGGLIDSVKEALD
ncbi:MAG: hypothetical protein AAF329_08640 [Cyanobacteria bacterium P01_A01_bin.17]